MQTVEKNVDLLYIGNGGGIFRAIAVEYIIATQTGPRSQMKYETKYRTKVLESYLVLLIFVLTVWSLAGVSSPKYCVYRVWGLSGVVSPMRLWGRVC